MAQVVKNLPAIQETWIQSLGQEDPWWREWLPTPVFLSGEFQGQRSLVGYSPRGRKELEATEQLAYTHTREWRTFRAHLPCTLPQVKLAHHGQSLEPALVPCAFSLSDCPLPLACSNQDYPLKLSSNAINSIISSTSLQPEIANAFNLLWYFLSALPWLLSFTFNYNYFGEGNGTPLQYSYLENPMDEGAW